MTSLTPELDNADDGDLHAASTSYPADAVLLTYKTRRERNDRTELGALRRSMWKHTGAKWQMLFHQGTVAKVPV